MTKYTKKSISITTALVTPKNCKEILHFVKQNKQLELVEVLNAYTTVPSCPQAFLDKFWKYILQHDAIKGMHIHNTNFVPSKSKCGRRRGVTSGVSLTELSFTFCTVQLPCVKWLLANFAHDTCLRKLVLSDNGMCDKEIEALCVLFQTNRSITHLDISNNQFGLDAVATVCCGLLAATNTNILTTLVIESNKIQDAGAVLLADALCTNTRLCILNVEDNGIGPKGIACLAEMLVQNTTLDMLSLAKNSSNRDAQTQLHRALLLNTRLRSLDVSGLHDNTEAPIEIAASDGSVVVLHPSAVDTVALMSACRCIQYLRLDNIHTSMASMQQIQGQLAQNTMLQRVSFVACGLTLAAVEVLAKGVSTNRSIRQLDLGDNRLCECASIPHHARELRASFWDKLSRNTTLEVLCLRGNSLGTRSMWHAAEFVAQHTSLRVLDVADNGIGSIGALVMLHALAKNKSILQLDMTQNTNFPLSYSRLLAALIRRRICAQETATLHVRGIALFVTARELRQFEATTSHRSMQITKHDLVTQWTEDCQKRKEAFLLLTRPRLCTSLLHTLCTDTLRIILSFDTLYS